MKLDLEELKKRLRKRTVLAITLESERIAASLMRSEEAEPRVEQSISIPIGERQVLEDPEKAGRDLAAALGGAGIRERRAIVCLPPGWALTSSADLPEVATEDLRSYLELRAEREFSIPTGDFRLGYCEYTLPDGRKRATLAALPSKKIEAVEQMLTAANRQGASISLALDKCLTWPEPKLHFLTNGNHTDVVVTAGGGIAGLRSLPGPGGETAFDAAAFCREVRITLGRMPEPLRQQVRGAEFGGPSAQKLCHATRSGLTRMGIETPACEYAPSAPESGGAAVETAKLFLRRQPVAFELVVPEAKPWQTVLHRFDTAGRRKLTIGAAAVIVLLLLVVFIRSEIESHLESQWESMKSTSEELDGLQQKIHQFHPWFDSTPEGLQLMETLATAFPDENDVWAKNVHVSDGNKVTCTGFARTHPSLLAFMDAMRKQPGITQLQVEQIRGDNPIQFTVSYQWEPQHD